MKKTNSKRKTEEWSEEEHGIFGEHGKEPAAETEKLLGRTGIFPRTVWRKGKYSIIPPCEITSGLWEAFDGEDTPRFETLKAAQEWCESPLTTSRY